ncbi:hypothetical protein CW714_07565 [Methanophagales archaeon]|nr:MAG: hypothetical protein CW714_07565 [Methanophagales archaeon]
MVFVLTEAVPQLLLAPKISPLFGFEALFAFLFLLILDCWTASYAHFRMVIFLKFLSLVYRIKYASSQMATLNWLISGLAY